MGLLISIYALADPWMLGFWAVSREGIAEGGWFRLFTAVVHHADTGHIVQNGLALLILGGLLEQRLGGWICAAVLLLAGLVGAIASALFVSGASVGASGGIYGIVGMWLVLVGSSTRAASPDALLPRGFWLLLVSFFLVDSVVSAGGCAQPAAGAPKVDWAAHLGGLSAGLVCGLVWRSMGARQVGEGAREEAGQTRSRRSLRLLVGALGALYLAGVSTGLARYGDGGPDAVAELPDGPRKWLLANNRAWQESVTGDAETQRLESWRELMQLAVGQAGDVPEYADTLATLHLELGDPWRAVELERPVSWAHEREPYTLQLARFAWAAVRSDDPPPARLAAPDRIRLIRDSSEFLHFEVTPAAGQRVPHQLDVICLRGGSPFGMLRLEDSAGLRAFDVPRHLLVSSAADAPLALIPIDGRPVVHTQPDEGAPAAQRSNLRFWSRSRAEFESRAALED